MHVCINVKSNMKRFCARLNDLGPIRKRKQPKRTLEISAPFNFKKEDTMLPGLTEDEITVLREKAAASRLGIADQPQKIGAYQAQAPEVPPRASARVARSPPTSPVSPVSTLDLSTTATLVTPIMASQAI